MGQAQILGLSFKNKVEQTMDIIKEYGQICWLDISKMDQTFTRLNNKFIKVKSHAEFLKYLNNNYKEIFKKDYINYKDIDQKYRCNSVLEGFHAILNEKMKKVNSIKDFVTCLKKIENEKYNQVINFERRGIKRNEASSNFGKEFCPKPIDKLIKNTSNFDNENQAKNRTKFNSTNIIKTKKATLKRKEPEFSNDKNDNSLGPILKKNKKTMINSNQTIKDATQVIIHMKSTKSKKTKVNIKSNKSVISQNINEYPWLIWSSNSCRYDALFTLGLYNKFSIFFDARMKYWT